MRAASGLVRAESETEADEVDLGPKPGGTGARCTSIGNKTVRAGELLWRAFKRASQLNALLMSTPGADDEFKRSVRTIEHAVWLARWELGLVAEEEAPAESEAA